MPRTRKQGDPATDEMDPVLDAVVSGVESGLEKAGLSGKGYVVLFHKDGLQWMVTNLTAPPKELAQLLRSQADQLIREDAVQSKEQE